ncbi:MAG: hypothetical protein AUK37_01605 [Rhodobacterales bacterium CG2_30_65_12]|nr:MAG: hypothetical protein AUK37_01605 [Rhodobacterales bacterium CG2_30_65_12]
MADWPTQKYRLQYPVTVGGTSYAFVTIRALNGRALAALDRLLTPIIEANKGRVINEANPPEITVEQALDMLKLTLAEPPEVVDELHMDDIAALDEVAGPFLEAATSQIGKTSSNGGEPKAT